MALQISTILQVATLVTIVTGLIFGVMEVRRASRERADKGALDVLSIAVRPDHIHASYAILDIPENASPRSILRSPNLRSAANTVMVQYEFLGILVFQGIVPLRTLDLLVGGIIRASWRRLRRYIESQRKVRNLPNIAEWFQWLAERLEEYGEPQKSLGTYAAFKDWTP
ncbi:MAG: hypothetical protein WD906_01110 [Anaerolineales bacterium]